ncbi:MAG: hypothetical protein ACLVEF_07860 [Bifidobacterium bifidum]
MMNDEDNDLSHAVVRVSEALLRLLVRCSEMSPRVIMAAATASFTVPCSKGAQSILNDAHVGFRSALTRSAGYRR